MVVVDKMLKLAEVKSNDVVYDLGSGDGRIVITAAKTYGASAVGIEIDPKLVKESRENVHRAGVGDLVEIRQQDILTADLSAATVVTMYLLAETTPTLMPLLQRQLKPGARIVSNEFEMDDWKPDKVQEITVPLQDYTYTIYLWRMRE